MKNNSKYNMGFIDNIYDNHATCQHIIMYLKYFKGTRQENVLYGVGKRRQTPFILSPALNYFVYCGF